MIYSYFSEMIVSNWIDNCWEQLKIMKVCEVFNNLLFAVTIKIGWSYL